ncbi:MAG: hypothetical protein GY926_09130 [bacterium]|nr:hypothetical protein [bacterium]
MMSRRVLLLAVVVTLLAAACGAGPDPAAGGDLVSARPVAYSLTGDLNLDYHTTMESETTMSFGEAFRDLDPALGSGMVTKMEMSFDTGYRIESGDEAGTYQVTMSIDSMELDSGSVEMGRESIDFSRLSQSELDAALEGQLTEVVYVINEKGEVLSMELAGMSIDVNAMLGGTNPGTISSGQMFGPELPEGEIQVGDKWTTTSEQAFGTSEPIVTEATHTVMRSEERNGYQTWLIRSKATTDAYTITWEDLVAMAESFGGLEAMGIDTSIAPSYQMSMRSAPSSTTTITWFDPIGGIVVASDVTANVAITMEMGGFPGLPGSVSVKVDGYTRMLMDLVDPADA